MVLRPKTHKKNKAKVNSGTDTYMHSSVAYLKNNNTRPDVAVMVDWVLTDNFHSCWQSDHWNLFPKVLHRRDPTCIQIGTEGMDGWMEGQAWTGLGAGIF